jgi:hypothetical protein
MPSLSTRKAIAKGKIAAYTRVIKDEKKELARYKAKMASAKRVARKK